MPVYHHKKHKTLLLEAEAEPSNPSSFLARCKAIVEDITSPVVKSVPLVIRHRVNELRPRARATYIRRQVKLYVPRWDAQSCNRLEKILGFILIIVGGLLLKPPDAEQVKSTAPVATQSTMQEPVSLFDEAPEMPFMADTAIDPSMLQQLSPATNLHPFSRFQSYANPRTRFSYENAQPAWNAPYMSSTHAACGMAQHFQHSMPIMIRNGRATVWNTQTQHGHPQVSAAAHAAQVQRHPQLQRMMRQVRKQAFQNYVNTSTCNATAIPMMKVAHQYHSLSQVLKQSCGAADSEETGDDE